MRTARLGFLALIAAATVIGLTPVYAFHDGGVAECSGCHSMHAARSMPLLQGIDFSSTCLNCHQPKTADPAPTSYHISSFGAGASNFVPVERTPGGDFAWLKVTTTWSPSYSSTTVNTNLGDTHGHNIVALDYGYGTDTQNAAAPGGSYLSTNLSCISCHDAHGKARRNPDGSISNPEGFRGNAGGNGTYFPTQNSGSYCDGTPTYSNTAAGVYRILASQGYQTDGVTFAGVPAACAPARPYNATENGFQVRVAYASTTAPGYQKWGDWCGTCHPQMHSAPSGTFIHPVDAALPSDEAANYNKYVSTGVLTASASNSFNSLVPFAIGYGSSVPDYSTTTGLGAKNKYFADGTQVGGAASGPVALTDEVMCLSCHRAHASAWPEMLRWNNEAEFLTEATGVAGGPATSAYPGSDAGAGLNQGQYHLGYSVAQVTAAYYDRPATKFSPFQRSLCNKCHIQD